MPAALTPMPAALTLGCLPSTLRQAQRNASSGQVGAYPPNLALQSGLSDPGFFVRTIAKIITFDIHSMDSHLGHIRFGKSFLLTGLLIAFFFGLILIACKKNESAYVKGQVLDETDGTPVAGIRLFLVHEVKDKNDIIEQIIVDSTVSDGMGFYRLQYHKQIFENYYLSWRNDLPNYLPTAGSIHTPNKRFANTVFLSPAGFLQVRVKKNGNTSSFIKVYPQSATPGDLSVIKRQAPFDTTFKSIFSINPGINHHVIFDFHAHSTANAERKVETFNINKGDTVLHTIEFE